MATAKKTATSKEKALADKTMHLAAFAGKQKCVPLKCTISGGPCLALVTCDPMSCGGLQCGTLKSV